MADVLQAGFWAAVLRAAQMLIASAPYLLIGALAAGLLRATIPPSRRPFAGGRLVGPLRAWGIATLLPVCSLGVVPLIRELRRAGTPRGALLTFALAAPILNPFSILYGLTLLQPWVLAVFVVATMAVSIGAGFLAGENQGTADDDGASPRQLVGSRRLLAAGAFAARELAGPSGVAIALGLLGVGLLASALPHGALQTAMTYGDRWAPLTILPIAAAAYVPPERAMMFVGEMYEHSNSPGAAFVLLTIGAGLNLGLLATLVGSAGPRAAGRWLLVVCGLTLALAEAIDRTCYLPGSEAGHTHIFDHFSSPFSPGDHSAGPAFVLSQLSGDLQASSVVALAGLAGLVSVGLVVRIPRVWRAVDAFLVGVPESRPSTIPDATAPAWTRPIPAGWLWAIGAAGLVGFSAVGALIYYPAPEEVFEDMKIVRADALLAVKNGPRDAAIRHVSRWESLAGKLPLGALLRRGSLRPAERREAQELIEGLAELRKALQPDGPADDSGHLAADVRSAYDRCRLVYLGR